MTKTREIVTGTYVDDSTYELRREDGSLFLKIKKGVPFRVGNKEWMPVSIPSDKGFGTILSCRRFGIAGTVIDEFVLTPNKKGLWALNAKSANNGVFHKYSEPKDELDDFFMKCHFGPRIVKNVDYIDVELENGGRIDKHASKPFGYKIYTDGKEEMLTTPEQSDLREHTIPADSTYQVRIYDANYIIYTQIWQRQSSKRVESIRMVMITPEADRSIVLKKLMRIRRDKMKG